MFYGYLKNGELDWLQDERIHTAIEYIRRTRADMPSCGEYEIDGRRIYAMIQAYDTKPSEEASWEGHRKYLDIHYIVSGEETEEYAPLTPDTQGIYHEEIDVLSCSVQPTQMIEMEADCFAVYFPNDLHKAKCHCKGKHSVQKILVKIALE